MSDTDGTRDSAPNPDTEPELDPLPDRAHHARFVLIGIGDDDGAEHRARRAAITRRLVAEHGFGFVAVTADGPDQRPIDAAVRLETDTDPGDLLAEQPDRRLADAETVALCRWLREHNTELPHRRRVGWYGLDAHPYRASLRAVADYLADRAPEYLGGPDAPLVPDEHLNAVTALLSLVHEDTGDREYAAQDEKLRAGAEGYYHALLTGGDFARNTRAAHQVATLEDLADHHGPNSRAVVWVEASQLADSEPGRHNLGDYLRERHGDTDVYILG